MKKHIQQVIVVEGHHDTEKLKKYYDCDTIETGGSHLGKEVLACIAMMQKIRGVIIFTDPDSAGNRIRNCIHQHVPGCQHAFVDKKDAHTKHKVGVEHASKETLDAALGALIQLEEHPSGELSDADLYELGISGKENSLRIRKWIGHHYHIGMGTAKTMKHRLNCLGISKDEVAKEITQWKKAK